MSGPLGVMLDRDAVRVLVRQKGHEEVRAVAWTPDAPEAMVEALRASVGVPSAFVVLVGLGFLEIAEPELPPLTADARRALLWRDADRYFPIAEPTAVVCLNSVALAMPAAQLDVWIRALRALAPVRAIITSPQAYARVMGVGSAQLAADATELGVVGAEAGMVRTVRRTSARVANDGAAGAPAAGAERSLDIADVLRSAASWVDAPLDAQLLDRALSRSLQRARQRQWAMSLVLVGGALALLAAAANHSRDARLTALQRRAVELSARAKPATLAETRQSRAHAELMMLHEADARQRASDAPLAVLAQLTRALPRDAFVQRVEFDGLQWRVDGTADNAPRIIPLLDGNPLFKDVRIAAPSLRFLDVGRQRESFAITFRLRVREGGANGSP